MRILAVIAILGLVAVPAFADKTAIPIESIGATVTWTPVSAMGSRTSTDNNMYDNVFGPTFTFAQSATPSTEAGDDVGLVHPGTATHVHYVYSDTGAGQTHYIWFYSGMSHSFVTGYSVTGLPGSGAYNVSITGLSVPFATTAGWMSVQPVNSPINVYGTPGAPVIGTSNPGYFTYNYFTSTWTYPVGTGNLAFAIAPEPMTIALFAIGGLVALRRRK